MAEPRNDKNNAKFLERKQQDLEKGFQQLTTDIEAKEGQTTALLKTAKIATKYI